MIELGVVSKHILPRLHSPTVCSQALAELFDICEILVVSFPFTADLV